jgi:hypothetical protein
LVVIVVMAQPVRRGGERRRPVQRRRCIQFILKRFLQIVNKQFQYSPLDRTYVRYRPLPGIERMFGWWCPVGAVEGSWNVMELALKMILIGYVMYSILGAPLVAARRDQDSGRRIVR